MRPLIRSAALVCASLLFSSVAVRADEAPTLPFRTEVGNMPAVQRGARDFMNYCSGCHSLKYLRYSRMGQDLGIPDDVLKKNLMFTSKKPGDTIVSSMPAAAKDWFGQQPPDLTLEAKARGADWVYTYLMSFYLDPKRPMGVNNIMLPGVAMPHVLGGLQGWQVKAEGKPVAEGQGGEEAEALPKFDLVQAGTLSPEEYKAFVGDLTNFMVYASEPVANDRVSVGIRVMVYLLVLLGLTYLLKKEFWRDVH
jgi:ubiquinol-cytochrome c reductase cytochrome c1 subunit